MANWRDTRNRAKASVHATFGIPAVYLTHAAGMPVPCTVRVHSKVSPTQNEFTWPQTSGFLEIDPRIILAESEVPNPLPKSYVILSQTEVYRIGTAAPPREGYASAEAIMLSGQELAAIVGQIDFTAPAYALLGG